MFFFSKTNDLMYIRVINVILNCSISIMIIYLQLLFFLQYIHNIVGYNFRVKEDGN